MIVVAHMAELVRDHVVDCIDRGSDQNAVEHKRARGRHRPPTLPQLHDDDAGRFMLLGIWKSLLAQLQALAKLCLCALAIPLPRQAPLSRLASFGLCD